MLRMCFFFWWYVEICVFFATRGSVESQHNSMGGAQGHLHSPCLVPSVSFSFPSVFSFRVTFLSSRVTWGPLPSPSGSASLSPRGPLPSRVVCGLVSRREKIQERR
jgi:hypothetical protein